jgi:hypothetical protein
MEEKRNHRRYPSLVWPIVLITAGVMFLLSNLGVLEVDFWQLWRLWPVLLILGGLDIILGRRSFVGNLVVVTLTVAIMTGTVILLAAAPDYLAPSTSGGVESIDEPLDGIERADLDIDFRSGKSTGRAARQSCPWGMRGQPGRRPGTTSGALTCLPGHSMPSS